MLYVYIKLWRLIPWVVLEYDIEGNILETAQYVWFRHAIQLRCFVGPSVVYILVVLMLKWAVPPYLLFSSTVGRGRGWLYMISPASMISFISEYKIGTASE